MKQYQQKKWVVLGMAALLAANVFAGDEGSKAAQTADAIRHEATRKAHDAKGWALPLLSSWNPGWNRGTERAGFDFDYQMALIAQGHRVLPWFSMEMPTLKISDRELAVLEKDIKRAAALKLPITFMGTQWEVLLTTDKKYRDVPPEQDPNILDADGKTVRYGVDAFGPIEPWKDVGRRWTTTDLMKKAQEWYPNPPLVIFLSNNEHIKLTWSQAESTKRYLDRYGKGRDDDFKRKVVAEGLDERYRAMLGAMREALVSPAWKKNAIFVGYGDPWPAHFGRWAGADPADGKTPGGWKMYASVVKGPIGAPVWDGVSPSYYVHNWNQSTDYTVWSPQVEAMNWVFAYEDIFKANPNYWNEISTWDGCCGEDCKPLQYSEVAEANLPAGLTTPVWPADTPAKSKTCFGTPPGATGPVYAPARYEGMIQFGMWLLRPRLVREFRGCTETVAAKGPYFMAHVEAVDQVHNNPTLREFWQKGTLVPNRAHEHPYQCDIPEEYKNRDRWFLLDTSLDAPRPWTVWPPKYGKRTPAGFVEPQHPWDQTTKIPVFALALVKGKAPERQWLVYAHSPWGLRKGVEITVPDYGKITVDVTQAGSFTLVDEKTRKVAEVNN